MTKLSRPDFERRKFENKIEKFKLKNPMCSNFDSLYIFFFSPFGKTVAEKVREVFPVEKTRINECLSDAFSHSDSQSRTLVVFVGALGICVRKISPFIKSKLSDPAVLCVDDGGNFVIPVLSGHVGGANEAALFLSEKIGAVPVITTSSDVHKKWALDVWLKENGFDFSRFENPSEKELLSDAIRFSNSASVSDKKIFSLGIGCRRGCDKKKLSSFVKEFFDAHSLPISLVAKVSSIDIKSDEEAILSFASEIGAKNEFFSEEELNGTSVLLSVDSSLSFSESEFVKKTVGVDCVCERASVIASEKKFLLVRKVASDGMTLAVSV